MNGNEGKEMRRINLKFLVIFAISLVIAGGGGYGFWYLNSGRSASLIRELAEEKEAKGELRKAWPMFNQYLALKPSDQETRGHVAVLAADIAELDDATFTEKRRAFRQLSRLLRSQPERDDLRRRLIHVLIAQGSYALVQKQVEALYARDVVDPELQYIYANSFGALGQYDEAIDKANDLIGYIKGTIPAVFNPRQALVSDMPKAYLLFAMAYRERGEGRKDAELADQGIEKMVEFNPDSADAFHIRGRYYEEGSVEHRRKHYEKVRPSFEKCLDIDPEHIECLRSIAVLESREKQYDKSLEYLERAQKIEPKNRQLYIDQARISRESGGGEENGIAYIEKGLEALPDDPELIVELFSAHLVADQPDKARALIEVMEKLNINRESIDMAEARLLMHEGKWTLALMRFGDLRPRMLAISETSVAEIDALMALCYQNLGQWDRQLATSRRLLSNFPRSPAGLRTQGQSLMAMQKYDEAIDVFSRLQQLIGREEFFADTRLRDTYMQLLFELGKESPRYNEQLRRLQRGIYESENIEAIDKAMVEIRALIADDKNDEALAKLEGSLVEYPDSEDIQDLYLASVMKISGPGEALEYLEQVTTRSEDPWKDRPRFLAARMEWISALGGFDAVTKLKSLEPLIRKHEVEDQSSLWLSLSRAHFALSRGMQKVDHCLAEAQKLSPVSREIAELRFESALLKNSENALLQALDQTEKTFGRGSDLWTHQRARYLIWANSLETEELDWLQEVETLAATIEDIRPRWHRLHQLKGLIADLKGKTEEAIEHYQRSLEFGPMDLEIAKKLTNLLISEGRVSETQDVMDRLDVVPASMIQTQILLHALSGDNATAREWMKKINWDEVENASNWIWRGRILSFMGDQAAAQESLERAVQLDADNVNSARALIDFFAKNRPPLSTFRHLQFAENRLSESPEAQTLLADTYSRFTKYTPRLLNEHYLYRAVAADPENVNVHTKYVNFCVDNQRLDAAIAHLSGILEENKTEEKQNKPLAVWARQTLARVLSSQPNHQSFQQALGLIEANRVGGQLSQYDTRLKGFLLAQRDEPIYRQHGIRLLEMVPDRALKRREMLALAELYYMSDRWRECKDLMEQLNIQYPDDIDLLARYCEMLFERKESNSGRNWLRKLKRVAPTSLPAMRMMAIEAKLGGPIELRKFEKKMLDSLAQYGEPVPANQRVRIGKVLETAGLLGASEKQYELAAKQRPPLRFQQASYLLRHGKLEEAMSICNEMADEKNVRAICTLLFSAMTSNPQDASPAHISQLSEWLDLAKKEYPDDWKVRIQEAFVRDMQGDTTEAVALLDAMDWDKLSEYEQGMVANNRAYFNIKRGQSDELVEQDLRLAFEKLGPKIELLDTRAMALMENRQFDEAIRDLQQATLFQPRTGRYHFHLALAHQGRDDQSSAREALDLAQSIGLLPEHLNPDENSKYESLQAWLKN